MPRSLVVRLLALMFAALLPLAAAQSDNPDMNLVDGLAADADFSILTGLLEQAGLLETLGGAGPFTVFAPHNGAFEELDADTLARINADPALLEAVLKSHVLEGTYGVNDLQDAEAGTLTTLQGEALEVDLGVGGLTVNRADLDSTNVENTYANGVVHVVGDLVLPPTIAADLGLDRDADVEADAATAETEEAADAAEGVGEEMAADRSVIDVLRDDGRFSTLVAAVERAGLVETLSGSGPFTLFAPTDEAFEALPEGQLDALLADEEALRRVLTHHVVDGNVTSADLSDGAVTTLEGGDVQVDLSDGVAIDMATVTEADLEAGNGVIHVIDTVLMPQDMVVE